MNVKVTGAEDSVGTGMKEDLGWRGTKVFKITTSMKGKVNGKNISSPS